MAVTFRSDKGAPLTHDEMDQNFREYFYSASYIGQSPYYTGIKFFRDAQVGTETELDFPTAHGNNYAIQVKSGSNNPSSSFLKGSDNFTFNYDTNHFSVSGSTQLGGDLTVTGKVTAREVITTISSSQILVSGSTRFGDTIDDTHVFTGSVYITGSLVGVADQISGSFRLLSESVQDIEAGFAPIDYVKQSTSSLSSSLAIGISASDASISSSASTQRINLSSSLATNIASLSSSAATTYLKNTSDTLTGDLTVTGTLTANTYIVSSSVTHLTTSFSSGSTKFGDSADDTHTFTGSVNILGDTTIVGTLTGNISGSASSASYIQGGNVVGAVSIANTASYISATNVDGTVNNSYTASYISATNIDGTVNNSYTASYVNVTNLDGTIDISSQTNLGVTDTTGQTGINFTLSGDDITGTLAGLGTSADVQFDSFGVGTAASGTTGEIRATGDITAYYSSDKRLKDNITPLSNAINKINQIGGYEFDWNSNSSHSGHDVGVIAQEIEAVLPEVVVTRDNGYKAVRYEKIVALLIEAIKDQQSQIDELKSRLD